MGRVELFYFMSTFFAIVLLSCFYSFVIFEEPAVEIDFNFHASPCDENNIEDAVKVGQYVYASNETAPETRFTKDNVTYGCPCSAKPCISKCCPFGQERNVTKCYTLNNTEMNGQADLFKNLKYNKSLHDIKPKINQNRHFNIKFNFIPGDENSIVTSNENQYFLFENGIVKANNNCNIIEHKSCYMSHYTYCIDSFMGEELYVYYNDDETIHAETKKHLDTIIYGYAYLVSGVSVILTLLIYTVLPSLRNLSGKCLMNYFLCMSMVFGWGAFQCLIPENVPKWICAFVGKFQLFILLLC